MGHEYDAMRNIEARMAAAERRANLMSKQMVVLTQLVESNNSALAEFIEVSRGLKLAAKVAAAIEDTAVWIAKVGAGLLILWASWKYIIAETISSIKVK
jgi:hypothetical protein